MSGAGANAPQERSAVVQGRMSSDPTDADAAAPSTTIKATPLGARYRRGPVHANHAEPLVHVAGDVDAEAEAVLAQT